MAESADQQTFARHVEDALAHIFDHFYLQFHPLSGLLAPNAPPALRGRTLSRLLVEAIERLRPGPGVPGNSLAWRKYHYTYLRYVQATGLEQISERLGVSDRQGRRDHRQALDALCTLLWDDYQATVSPPAPETEPANPPATDLEGELLRLGRVAPRSASHLADVVAGALTTTKPLIDRQGCPVTLDVPAVLPPVAINPLILREIIIGLITQAVELSDGSEVKIVAVAAGAVDVLTVSCHASPPSAAVERLETSRRLAELQGGQLRVAYQPDDRSLGFALDLPVAERASILVIDDNPDVVLLFRRYLGQTYRLIQATTADEALALAEELRPSLVTLDVMMPGLDGWQILDQLRRNPRTAPIPVVVCSILPEPSLALALGAVAYLQKPVNPLALRSMLDREIEASR